MADAQASGACGRKIVWVQVPSPALFFLPKTGVLLKRSSYSIYKTPDQKISAGIQKHYGYYQSAKIMD